MTQWIIHAPVDGSRVAATGRGASQARVKRMKAGVPLVVIMPVFEDRESASLLMKDLARHCPTQPFIVAVEDGSLRNPLQASDIAAAGLQGEVLYLTRNMGHQRAIATGLAYASAHYNPLAAIVMDSDGEDRPEAIGDLLARLDKGDVDAVVAQRRRRSESLQFRIFYIFYRLVFQIFTGRTIRFGNFTALSQTGAKRLSAMHEMWVHFAASIMTSRLRVAAVPIDRGKRYAGTSTMNFFSLTLHGMRSMMVFAEDVLIRVGTFCALLAVGTVGLMIAAISLKLFGVATPGWFTTASGILFVILLQAGILTFVTLMISGIVRSAPPVTRAELDRLIDRVESTVKVSSRIPLPQMALTVGAFPG